LKPSPFLAACFAASWLASAAYPEEPSRAPETAATAVPAVLWRDPGPVERRDLFWGSGAESRQPLPPFKLVRENLKGTVPKVLVTDARGHSWDVKFGPEAHSEVISNRLVWALGYMAQEMYYVPKGTLEGVTTFKRAGAYVSPEGRFTEARFRLRDPAIFETGGWSLASNPFVGQRELSGLIILMALLNNWDTQQERNTRTFRVSAPSRPLEDWYVAKDLGASFGRFVGPQGTPIKWFLASYQKDGLIEKVEGGAVHLIYPTFDAPLDPIPAEHAQWFANLVGRLTPAQIRRAFEAGGAKGSEVEGFSAKLGAKIAELREKVGASPPHRRASQGEGGS
jgi:hypothetical protein